MSSEEIKQLMEEFQINNYIETSAKTGFNTKQLFINISNTLMKDYHKYQNTRPVSHSLYSKQSSVKLIKNEKLLNKSDYDSENEINPSRSTCSC